MIGGYWGSFKLFSRGSGGQQGRCQREEQPQAHSDQGQQGDGVDRANTPVPVSADLSVLPQGVKACAAAQGKERVRVTIQPGAR